MNTKEINILGFGVMGRQIAALFSLMGYRVKVWNRSIDESRKEQYRREVRLLQKRLCFVSDPGELSFTTELSTLCPILTYEAILEDISIKRSICRALPFPIDEVVFLTNTSSYMPQEISPSAIGLHFFNPIHALKFAEIVGVPPASGTEVQNLLESLQSVGFEVIHTNSNRGYVGNFILFHEIAAALKLIDEYQYKTHVIDRVLAHMGRSVSLFDVMDIIGIDVVARILINLAESDPSIYISDRLKSAVAAGVLGRRNRMSIRSYLDESPK